MKITSALTLVGALIALPALAQNQGAPGGAPRPLPGGGVRILPAPAPDADFAPGFPGPDVPDEAWIEPGMPGMMMPDMPGRYTLLSAQITQNGKPVPVVLRIDTTTGQVWQLKTLTRQVRRNGKIQAETSLGFVMVNEPGNLAPGRQPHHGGAGGGAGGGVGGGFPGGAGGALPGLPAPAPGIGAEEPATETVPARPAPRPFPRNRRPNPNRNNTNPAPPEGANTTVRPNTTVRSAPAIRIQPAPRIAPPAPPEK